MYTIRITLYVQVMYSSNLALTFHSFGTVLLPPRHTTRLVRFERRNDDDEYRARITSEMKTTEEQLYTIC